MFVITAALIVVYFSVQRRYLSKEVIRYMGVRDLVWLIIVIVVIVVVLRFLGIL